MSGSIVHTYQSVGPRVTNQPKNNFGKMKTKFTFLTERKGAPHQGGPPRKRGPLDKRVRLRRRLLGTSSKPLFAHHARGAIPGKSTLPAAAAADAAVAAAVTPLSAMLQQGVCPSRLERLLQQQLQRQQQQRREKRREKQLQLETLRLQQTRQLHALQQRFGFASAAAAAAGEAQQQQQQEEQSFSPVVEAAALAAAGLLARLRASRLGVQLDQSSPPNQQVAQHQLLPAPFPRLHRKTAIECSSSSSRESRRGLGGSGRSHGEEEHRKNCLRMTHVKSHEKEASLWPLIGTAASAFYLQKNYSTESSSDDRPSARPIAPNTNSSSSNSSSSSSSRRLETEERGIQVSLQLSPRREKREDFAVSSLDPVSVGSAHSSVTASEAATVSPEGIEDLKEEEIRLRRKREETVESSQGHEAQAASPRIHLVNGTVERLKGETPSEQGDTCTEELEGLVAASHAAAAEASSTHRGGGRIETRRQVSLLGPSAVAAGATTNAAAALGATAAEAAAIRTRGIPLVYVMREKYPRWRRRRASRVDPGGPPRLHAEPDHSLPLLLGREGGPSWGPPTASAGRLISGEKEGLDEEPLIASISGLNACMLSGAVSTQRFHLSEAAVNSGGSRRRGSRHSKAPRKEEERWQHADDWRSLPRYGQGTSIVADAFESPPLKGSAFFNNNYEIDIFAEKGPAPAWRADDPHVTSGPLSISTVDDQWSSRGWGAAEDGTRKGRNCFQEVRKSGFSRRQNSDFLSKSFAAKTLVSSVSIKMKSRNS
ncbi:hypothetical protein Esti_003957 [Eimeria stiedai]